MSAQRNNMRRPSVVHGLSEEFHEIVCVTGALVILTGALLASPRVAAIGVAIIGAVVAIDWNGRRQVQQHREQQRDVAKRNRACRDRSICR